MRLHKETNTLLYFKYLSLNLCVCELHFSEAWSFFSNALQAEGSPQYFSRSVLIDLRTASSFATSIAVTVPEDAVPGSEYIEVQITGRWISFIVVSLGMYTLESLLSVVRINSKICLVSKPVNVQTKTLHYFSFIIGNIMTSFAANIANLIQLPYGCGEQNMLNFAPDVVVLDYLNISNLLTEEVQTQLINYLETGNVSLFIGHL